MEKSKTEHKLTEDGSSTLYAEKYQQHYHSIHGAVQESMHVFIQSGLDQMDSATPELRIFEMGFGTGLNALLSILYTNHFNLHYTAIEAEPLPEEVIATLNYPECIEKNGAQEFFPKIHAAPWNEKVKIDPIFHLHKIEGKLEDFETEERFDLIYFDAFAPNAQPELWDEAIIQKMFTICRPGAIFVTYSAKSNVRRAMIAAGFEVEKIPGPPGKREMLRGRVPA
ncbi:MAG: tRNA (5-methylaminomethyl-2-thiouridine)(34)-methyltransferase MnmD [Bacteroidota bacterium]